MLLALALASAWVGAFAMHNRHWVPLNLPDLGIELGDASGVVLLEAQLAWLVLGACGVGFVAAVLLIALPGAMKAAFRRRRDRRLIDALEGELADLRRLQVLEPTPLDDLAEPEAARRVGARASQHGREGAPELETDLLDLDGTEGREEPRR